jgi:signal transduction histidine kinase/CheY-like chemotaxis protein
MIRPFQLVERARPFFVVASIVALIIAALVAAGYSERQYKAQTTQAATVQARILADTVTAAVAFGDREALREYVSALKADADVDVVGVYDAHDHLMASFTRSHLADRLSETATPATAPGRIIVTAPVVQDGQRLGAVYLRDRTEPLLRRISRYIPAALLVLMASLTIGVTILDARALARTNEDLKIQMAEREKAEAALRQSQKMEAVGRLTGGIAHDFNNMLAIVVGSLDILLRRYADADAKMLKFARQAMEGAQRAAALTQRLLAFSRLQPLKPASADIARAVSEMAELLRRTLGETVAIEIVTAGGLWRAHIDLPQLEIAIVNLAINARDAMPNGGKLTIETANAYLDRLYAEREAEVTPGQYVMIAVSDTGAGISPEIMAQVFEPFFTTKPSGLGTGLGLSQVQGFIKQSGGHVRIYSEAGVGTTVKLYLPRSTSDLGKPSPTSVKSQSRKRRDITVLVVEDEAGVRDFAVEALAELGYDVVAADSPATALDLLDSHPEASLLLTDVVMPETNGRLLAEEALRRRPALRVVFMTGYTQNAIIHNGVVDAGAHLLTKPFTVAQLEAELAAALASGSKADSTPR